MGFIIVLIKSNVSQIFKPNISDIIITLLQAALPKTGEIVLLEMSQRFHIDHLDKVMEVALDGCKDIANILDEVVRKHVTAATASLDFGS